VKTLRFIVLAALGTGVCAGGRAAQASLTETFDRYQVILERRPFGEAPAAPDAGVVIPEAPPFVRQVKMCAITEDAAGVMVGFLDISQQPPKAYYLAVGESEDGYEVLDADYAAERALLRKDGQEEWISMEGATGLAGADVGGGMSPALSATSGAPGTDENTARRLSYAERLRRRREAVLERRLEQPKLEGDALKKHLEEYQMQLIREGMPALPIPLTPEMDEQLVQEGVLPPIEAAPGQ
jgi:hypothetical protein